jgi:hypothetical protein
MAKTKDSPAQPATAPAPAAKIYTESDMNVALLRERYIAWHTVSKMRSYQFGDTPEWVAAADTLLNIFLTPPQKPEPVKEELFEESGTETEPEDDE